MNLLAFIDLVAQKDPDRKSDSSLDKDAVCLAALQAYLAGSDCDIRQAVLPQFISAFGTFLAHDYHKDYSPATCREILRTLRKFLRHAIISGYVPNIDAVPAVISQLDSQLWQSSPSPRKQPAAPQRLDLHVIDSLRRLMRTLDSWSTKQKMSHGKPVSKEERTLALQARCAAIYYFCILTCGIEIRDALAITRECPGTDVPDSVYIARYGMRLPLSPSAKKLVELYNQGSECTQHLFFTLDNKKYKDDLDNAARLIEGHASRYIQRQQLPLFVRQSVYTDWLNGAIERGLPDPVAQQLWQSHLAGTPAAAVLPAIQDAQSRLADSTSSIAETWYVLSLIPFSIKRDKLVRMFVVSGILGTESEAARRIYAPEEGAACADKGESAVFGRYIFFRGTPIQAEFANCFSPYAYVLKDRANRRFAQIRESEILSLQVMLRDFPDAVELVDGEKWLRQHNAEIVEGCTAIIRSGSLAGKEAKVVRIKGRATSRPTYIIEYIEGALKFQTNLDGLQLDLVAPAPQPPNRGSRHPDT